MNLSDLSPTEARNLGNLLSGIAVWLEVMPARVTLEPHRLEIRWDGQGREASNVGPVKTDRATALEGLRDALYGLEGIAARDQTIHTETPALADSSPAVTGEAAGSDIPRNPAAINTPAETTETGAAAGDVGDGSPAAHTFGREWTAEEDAALVAEAVRRGPGYVASLLCRFMAPILGRSEGAVKLRLYRPEIAYRIADGHEAALRAPKLAPEPATKLEALPVPEGWTRQADLAMCEGLFKGVNLKRQADDFGATFQFLTERFADLKAATVGRGEMSIDKQKAMLAALREVV